MGRRQRLGHAVALDVIQPGQVLELLGDRLGHGGATTAYALQAGQVIVTQLWIREEIHHHGRDRLPDGHAMALDAAGGHVTVPAREQHDGGARVERATHAAGHAGHMEERQD